jgi:hemoglobin-like flavoprotein
MFRQLLQATTSPEKDGSEPTSPTPSDKARKSTKNKESPSPSLPDDSSSVMSERGAADDLDLDDEGSAAPVDSRFDAGDDVNVTRFDELVLEPQVIEEAKNIWKIFLSAAGSRDAAGEAIYSALFEGAPSLQTLFTTPRAVQAIRFMNGLHSFVNALDDPAQLKILVETLGFGHLNLDVTVPRVVIFRDAILDLFEMEVGSQFSVLAKRGWKSLLNYVGGAIIFVKSHYAERLKVLAESWKAVNSKNKKDAAGFQSSGELQDTSGGTDDIKPKGSNTGQAAHKKGSSWKSMFGKSSHKEESGDSAGGAGKTNGHGLSLGHHSGNNSQQAQVPTTYHEMFQWNAAVMGFGSCMWMNEVLTSFDTIVTNASNSSRLQEECDVLVLKISKLNIKDNKDINLAAYKSCMLASLRSLLPKAWDSAHEVAWTWLWENVERLMRRTLGSPPLWQRKLEAWLEGLDEEQRYEIRKEIYSTFFVAAPAGQEFFKQSNTYLHFIAERMLCMTGEIYQNPAKMVDDILSLGLRHVGYGIPTDLFGPFVTACIEVVASSNADEGALEAFRWSLGLISMMLVRTITEGSTIVMKAVDANSASKLRKAVSCAPRCERAKWLLVVQVGTQSISPLEWAIQSGCLEAAKAIIEDLLTIRADRERYYYGVDQLFSHHPDILKRCINDAATLLPTLWEHLVWRARTTSNGQRRVNFYVKHLIVAQDGSPSLTLRWLTDFGDPNTMANPVVVLVQDTLWHGMVLRRFAFKKVWFVLRLFIFMASQAIFPKLQNAQDIEIRYAIFVCRCINYCLVLTHLVYFHCNKFCTSYRQKDTRKFCWCVPVPKYLSDTFLLSSFVLMCLLMAMCASEPMFHCLAAADPGESFKDFPTEFCSASDGMMFRYTVFGMCAMVIQWGLITDMSVFSTQLSAFNLVVRHVLSEIGRFLVALVFLLFTFGSAISVIDHNQEEMKNVLQAAVALFAITVKLYQDDYRGVDEPAVIVAILLYQIASAIVLLNLLISQLQCSYDLIYKDAVGYARLSRSNVIAETIAVCPRGDWDKFVETLKFDKKLEFTEGDIGINGGIQDYEPARLHPIVGDTILRYGGTTSPDQRWPDEKNEQEEENKFDRMERLLHKTIQRVGHLGAKDSSSRGMDKNDKNSNSLSQSNDDAESGHSGTRMAFQKEHCAVQ